MKCRSNSYYRLTIFRYAWGWPTAKRSLLSTFYFLWAASYRIKDKQFGEYQLLCWSSKLSLLADSVLSLRPCPAADITAHLSNRLPLLRHDASPSLRRAYVDLMRQVRLAAPDTCRSLEDCRHLFSLALLHPAFSTEDRLQIQELVFNGYGPPGCGSGNGRGSRSPLSPSQPLRADSGLGLDQMPTSGGFQCGYPELTNTAAAAAATNSSGEQFLPRGSPRRENKNRSASLEGCGG